MICVKPLRSELPFASFLAYAPRGDGPEREKSRVVVRQVKENRMVRLADGQHMSMAVYVARRLCERSPVFVQDFLGPDSWLVPIPRSGLRRRGTLWPALELNE